MLWHLKAFRGIHWQITLKILINNCHSTEYWRTSELANGSQSVCVNIHSTDIKIDKYRYYPTNHVNIDFYQYPLFLRTSRLAQTVKWLPKMWETWVQSLGWQALLEKKLATHFSILAWKIPRTDKPGRLQSMRSQRVRLHFFLSFLFLKHFWNPQ